MKSWRNQTNATAYEGSLHAACFRRSRGYFEYMNRRNPRVAREVKAHIDKRIAALGDSIVRHRLIPRLGVQALYIGRYPYIVCYRVGRDEISIVHIRHASRRPWEGEGD